MQMFNLYYIKQLSIIRLLQYSLQKAENITIVTIYETNDCQNQSA